MNWNKSLLSDSTNIDAISITYGNGYYVAVSIQVVSGTYTLNIMYTQNPADGWATKTLKNTGVDNIFTAGIAFTGSYFVIPYTTAISHAFSVLVFSDPTGDITDREAIFSNTLPITLNSVRYIGSKVIVCGTKSESDIRPYTSGWIWYCTDPTSDWESYCVVEYSAETSTTGRAFDAAYDTQDSKYNIYAVARTNDTTNYHRIYETADLATWHTPTELANDTLSSPPFPTLAYCADYDALCLFLHGKIYISKGNQDFISIDYPTSIGTESVRTATSDGTKFLASSASNNQADLKVLYSDGDPVVASNWHVDTLSTGNQVSNSAQFINGTKAFIVLAGAGGSVQPAIYTAKFNANEFNRMKDRVPTYPGRIKLTSAGEADTYYLERYDEPTEEGTKLSKANLLSDDASLAVWNNTPPSVTCTPSSALEHLGNNAFHVGDILTTVRDLSGNDNWLKCDGSAIDPYNYPELAALLDDAAVEGNWQTNEIDSQQNNANGIVTDGEWYVVKADPNIIYYTRDPSGTWTKKTFSGMYPSTEFLYDGRYFVGFKLDNTTVYAIYAASPEDEWTVKDVYTFTDSATYGWTNISYQCYANNTHVLTLSGSKATSSGGHNLLRYSSALLYGTSLDSTFTYKLFFTYSGYQGAFIDSHIIYDSKQSSLTSVNYCNSQWLVAELAHTYYRNENLITPQSTSGSDSNITKLYYVDDLASFSTSSSYVILHNDSVSISKDSYPSAGSLNINSIVYGGTYYLLSGSLYSGSTTSISQAVLFYSTAANGNFTRYNLTQAVASGTSHIKYYNNVFMFLAIHTADRYPYLYYSADPSNWPTKQLIATKSDNYSGVFAIDANTDTVITILFHSASGDAAVPLTALWRTTGKALPKYNPGLNLTAYIKAKEGD